jgi:hypothetical protein
MLRAVSRVRLGDAAQGGVVPAGAVSLVCASRDAAGRDEVALALGARAVLVVRGAGSGGGAATTEQVANLAGLRALTWAGRGRARCLVAGYQNGLLRVLAARHGESSVEGKEFVIHGAPVAQLLCSRGAAGDERVWVLYDDKVLLSVPLGVMHASASWAELEPKVWRLSSAGSVAGAAVFPLRSLYHAPEHIFSEEPLWPRLVEPAAGAGAGATTGAAVPPAPPVSQRFAVLTAGSRPTWALFVTPEPATASHGKRGAVAAVASAVAGRLATTSIGSSVVSFARSWVGAALLGSPALSSEPEQVRGEEQSGEGSSADDSEEEQDASDDDQHIQQRRPPPGSAPDEPDALTRRSSGQGTAGERPLRVRHGITDSAARQMSPHVNAMDPSLRYFVTADTLGRVTLIDSAGLRVMRVWKGYRDAQTAWLSGPEQWVGQWDEANHDGVEPRSALDAARGRQVQRWGQYLVVLAPWRQTVQLWRVPGCVLIASFRVQLRAPERAFLATSVDAASGAARCLLLSADSPLRDSGSGSGSGSEETWEVSRVELDLESVGRLTERQQQASISGVGGGPGLSGAAAGLAPAAEPAAVPEGFVAYQFRRAVARGRVPQALELFATATDATQVAALLAALDSATPSPPPQFDAAAHQRLLALASDALAAGDTGSAGAAVASLSGSSSRSSSTARGSGGGGSPSGPEKAPSLASVQERHARLMAAALSTLLSRRKSLVALFAELALDRAQAEALEELAAAGAAGIAGGSGGDDSAALESVLPGCGADTLDELLGLACCTASSSSGAPTAPMTLPELLSAFGGAVDARALRWLRQAALSGNAASAPPPSGAATGALGAAGSAAGRGLAVLLFRPLLADVFVLPRVESAVTRLELAPGLQGELFVDWWFSIELPLLVAALANPRNALRRFLERLLGLLPPLGELGDLVAMVSERSVRSEQLCHALALAAQLEAAGARRLPGAGPAGVAAAAALSSLRARLGDAVFLSAQVGAAAAAAGLNITVGSLALPRTGLSALLAAARAAGLPATRLDELQRRWPRQCADAADAALCHQALLLLERRGGPTAPDALAAALRCVYDVKVPEVRAALAARVWNTFALAQLLQALALAPPEARGTEDGGGDGGSSALVRLCEAGQELLALLRNAVCQAERATAAGTTAYDPLRALRHSEAADPARWVPACATLALELGADFFAHPVAPDRLEEEAVALLALRALLGLGAGDGAARPAAGWAAMVRELFPAGASVLEPGSLELPALVGHAEPAEPAEPAGEREQVEQRRAALVARVLRQPAANLPEATTTAYALGQAFRLPEDRVRREHATVLYARGLDAQAEPVLSLVAAPGEREQTALALLAVARARMSAILYSLQNNPRYRHLLAVISADTSRWIRGAGAAAQSAGDAGAAPGGSAGDAASLSATLVLLRRVQEALPPSNAAQMHAVQMVRAADALFRRVQEMRQ